LSAPEPTGDARPFEAPWQAQVFAMTVSLHERGLFSWQEWTEALGAALKVQHDYYTAWTAALEGLLRDRRVVDAGEVDAVADAWARAAEATPHGMPILLKNGEDRPPQR
jgi:nitrile hydratase accessory protein